MKKFLVLSLIISFALFSGCKGDVNDVYLPEAENDKVYTAVGFGNESYCGEGYTIDIGLDDYLYEKYDTDGDLQEIWKYSQTDGAQIEVTTCKNSDNLTAVRKFLDNNNSYIFEDLTGYSLCGQDAEGNTLWFNLHTSDKTVYVVSWRYPENATEDLKKELAGISASFSVISE